MKILILSDIHGNIAALDAIQETADYVFCLGDIVNYGPYPGESIARIRSMTKHVVRGNHDNAIGRDMDCGCSLQYKELSDAGKIFTGSVLNTQEKDYLAHLPTTLGVELNGKEFLLAHGSPSGDIYKYLKPNTPDKELEDKIKGIHADVIFVGHTHLPMIRKINNVTMVNPGSVGQPRDGIPTASYAVWEDGHIEVKRVPYDIEATVRGLQATNIPPHHITTLAKILRNGGM